MIFHAKGLRNPPNKPKQHFGSNAVDWMHLWQNYFRKIGTPIVHQPQTQVLHYFKCQSLTKWFEIFPNIVLSLKS